MVHSAEVLTADEVGGDLGGDLGHCLKAVLLRRRPKVDVRLRKFVLELHRVTFVALGSGVADEGGLSLGGVGARLAEVDRIDGLGDGRSFHNLAVIKLPLTDLIVNLAGSRGDVVSPRAVIDREVTLVGALPRNLAFGGAAKESLSGRCLVHGCGAGLSDVLFLAQGEVAGPQVGCLLGNIRLDLRVVVLVASLAGAGSVARLLQSRERLVVVCGVRMANLDLVDVGGTLLGDLLGLGVRRCNLKRRAFLSFELVAALEAHFEIVLALGAGLLLQGGLVEGDGCRLLHTALVLAHVVQLVAPEAEVGLNAAYSSKNLVCVTLPLLDRVQVLRLRVFIRERVLCRTLREVEMLGRQIGSAQFVEELEALRLGVGVEGGAMVLKVLSVLGHAVESVSVAKAPVTLGQVRLGDGRLRIPLLSFSFFK